MCSLRFADCALSQLDALLVCGLHSLSIWLWLDSLSEAWSERPWGQTACSGLIKPVVDSMSHPHGGMMNASDVDWRLNLFLPGGVRCIVKVMCIFPSVLSLHDATASSRCIFVRILLHTSRLMYLVLPQGCHFRGLKYWCAVRQRP